MNKEKLNPLNINQIVGLRKGQSESKIRNANSSFEGLPNKLTFTTVGVKYFLSDNGNFNEITNKDTINDFLENPTNPNIKVVVGLYTEEGFFVSESQIFSSTLLNNKDSLILPKRGNYKDKSLLGSKRLSDYSKLGKTDNSILMALQGLTVNVIPEKEQRRYKQDVFSNFSQVAMNNEPTDEEINNIWENFTELKDMNKFVVSVPGIKIN